MHVHTRRILFCIVLLAVVVRAAMLWLCYCQNPSYFHNDRAQLDVQIADTTVPYHNSFGSELSNVAYALVSGEGLANPFGGDTGPTGWAAPGMVMLYALAFALFGCFSTGSILFMFALALCLSALTIILVFHVSTHLFKSPTIACIASCLYALDPQDMFIFKRIGQQDFNIYPFLFLLCFFLFLRFLRSRSTVDGCLFGLASAFSMLCNPVFVLPVTACCLYYILVNRSRLMCAVRETAVVVLVCILLMVPYILHQYQQLHTWSFVKSNGAFELYLGNVPDFEGVLTFDLFSKYHPMSNIDEYRAYRDMGEKAYIKSRLAFFIDRFDPARFARLSLKRCMNFFFWYPTLSGRPASLLHSFMYSLRGLALIAYALVFFRRFRAIDVLLYTYILMYALPFCFLGIMYRYSFTIVPLSSILWAWMAYTLYACGKRIKVRWS